MGGVGAPVTWGRGRAGYAESVAGSTELQFERDGAVEGTKAVHKENGEIERGEQDAAEDGKGE